MDTDNVSTAVYNATPVLTWLARRIPTADLESILDSFSLAINCDPNTTSPTQAALFQTMRELFQHQLDTFRTHLPQPRALDTQDPTKAFATLLYNYITADNRYRYMTQHQYSAEYDRNTALSNLLYAWREFDKSASLRLPLIINYEGSTMLVDIANDTVNLTYCDTLDLSE